ncbi:MAG: GumC family protein [Terriglobales bacterium]
MENSGHNSVLSDIERISELDYPSPVRHLDSDSQNRTPGWTIHASLLLEKREFIFKTTVRVLLVSTLLVFVIPAKYQSTARIMPPEQAGAGTMLALLASGAGAGGGSGSGSGSAGLGALAGGILGMKTTGALYVDLLRSRTVEGGVVQKFNLQKIYRTRYEEDAIKALDQRTTIDEDRKSGVISISVMDSDPHRSRDLVEAYLTGLDSLLSNVSTSSARRERIFIEQRLVGVRSDLEDAEHQFSQFASKNSTLDIKEQGKAMVDAAAVLQGQLMAAQSELQGLEEIYTPSNVRVRSLRARVQELQNQLQKFAGNGNSPSPDELFEPKASYPTIKELPLLGVQWTDLYRRVRVQETVYELLNQQYELARIQEARDIPSVRVVDPADVPEKKSWPPRLAIILVVTILWVLVAVLWVLGSNRWSKISPEDPRKTLAVSVLDKMRDWKSRQASRFRLTRNP